MRKFTAITLASVVGALSLGGTAAIASTRSDHPSSGAVQVSRERSSIDRGSKEKSSVDKKKDKSSRERESRDRAELKSHDSKDR